MNESVEVNVDQLRQELCTLATLATHLISD